MIERPFWIGRIQAGWEKRPVVWLSGVRRSGKTTLAQSLEQKLTAQYFDCDLPAVAEMVRDPELFLRNRSGNTLIFDEIHQLSDPSRLLKIGADLFPGVKILATGSSTLAAGKKFRDSLTGRKINVHLAPALWDEFPSFQNATLHKRLYHGGLPPALLSPKKEPGFYREWTDSFFARDLQKLFGFRKPDQFTPLFEYLMRVSGGLWDLSKAASELGISRPTVLAYLRAMEITHAVQIVRPFFGGGHKELVKIPKVFGFDTGFVSFFRGWDPLRPGDYGVLWEHLALEWLTARYPDASVRYWRDLSGRELDFVIPISRDRVDVVECKWNPSDFDVGPLKTFRAAYPGGRNYILSPVSTPPHERRFKDMTAVVCNPSGLPCE